MPNPRIAILHQGCVPSYRRAFFERLGQNRSRDYVVFHGQAEPGSGIAAAPPPFGFQHVEVRNRFWRILGRSLVYQPVFLKVAGGGFDALVVGHEVKYLANIALILLFRLRGKPVLLWGFGQNLDITKERRSPLGRWVGGVVRAAQMRMLRMATDFLAYTSRGAEHAMRSGMERDRVTVLNNTIDTSAEVAAHARAQSLDRAALRRDLGLSPDAVVFLFVGRLNEAKRADALIEAVRALRRRQPEGEEPTAVEVLIVGSGPAESDLRELARGETWCRFLGQVQESDALGRIFRASDAVVIPGYVGLAVNHAFAHGLPVITCHSELHSPEIDYVEPGVNGLILRSLDELADGLLVFASSVELRRSLSAGALLSREKLDLRHMVEAFDHGVSRALHRSTPTSLGDQHLLKTR
jgi:glycosyltransferase involved in cell wall biosynthesis